jgi:membrane fusion protein (multidrug efflux system)
MHDVARPVLNRPTAQSPPKRRRKAIVVAVALLLAIGAFVVGTKFLQIGKMMSMPHTMPPTTVTSASVKEEDWAPRLTAVGSVSAVQGAVVSAELAGVVSEINFQNGGEAKKGEVLMKLDASQEEALLRSAEAEAQLAQTDL